MWPLSAIERSNEHRHVLADHRAAHSAVGLDAEPFYDVFALDASEIIGSLGTKGVLPDAPFVKPEVNY